MPPRITGLSPTGGAGGGDTQERFARLIPLENAEEAIVDVADQIAAPTTIAVSGDLIVFDVVFPAAWGGSNVTITGPDRDVGSQTDTIVYAGTGRAHGSKVFFGGVAAGITAIATVNGGGTHNASVQIRNVLCAPQANVAEFTSIARLDTAQTFTAGTTDLVNGWVVPTGDTVGQGGYYKVGYR